MHPLVTMEMARVVQEERRREAAAWRAVSEARRPGRWRRTVGVALQRVGSRLADAPAAAMPERRAACPEPTARVS